MRPQWFDLSPQAGSTADALELGPIPFDDMWEDDKYWFPMLLSDAKFIGRVDFSGMNSNGTGGSMRRWWFGRDRSE
jgi:8-oxo-dGTP diphosphatase/2-hydroxy-dATP diphosphatase